MEGDDIGARVYLSGFEGLGCTVAALRTRMDLAMLAAVRGVDY